MVSVARGEGAGREGVVYGLCSVAMRAIYGNKITKRIQSPVGSQPAPVARYPSLSQLLLLLLLLLLLVLGLLRCACNALIDFSPAARLRFWRLQFAALPRDVTAATAATAAAARDYYCCYYDYLLQLLSNVIKLCIHLLSELCTAPPSPLPLSLHLPSSLLPSKSHNSSASKCASPPRPTAG